jgi:hypothetical protein
MRSVPHGEHVIIALRYIVDRARHHKHRARELFELRRRLERSTGGSERELLELAEALRKLRERLWRALGSVESCSSCARGHPLPFGQFPGGHCCGGSTHEIFSDDELAALALGGTTPSSLRAPYSEPAGCAFRGATGCSLGAGDRPTLCVRYTCRELERELAESGAAETIRALQTDLDELFRRFVAARARTQRAEAES